jgi:hypothetical protein
LSKEVPGALEIAQEPFHLLPQLSIVAAGLSQVSRALLAWQICHRIEQGCQFVLAVAHD